MRMRLWLFVLLVLVMPGLAVWAQVEPAIDPRKSSPGVTLPEVSPTPSPPPAPITPTSSIGTLDPARYRLDEGDVLQATIEGPRAGRLDLVCWSDGSVILPPAGRVSVVGLTVKQAEEKLTRAYARYRRNFRLTVTVVAVRRFQVQIVGAVLRPGTYEVDGLTPIFQALQLAGGATESGSKRRISLFEDASLRRKLGSVDLQAWTIRGLRPKDSLFYLRRRQVIVVPDIGPTASVRGQVYRPGRYEFLDGESVHDLLEWAGGLTPNANRKEMMVGRLHHNGIRQQIPLQQAGVEPRQLPLQAGDEVQVYDLTLEQPYVAISGELVGKDFFPQTASGVTGQPELARTGLYRIRDGESLRQAVLALGGPTIQADLRNVRIEGRQPDGSLESQTVNLGAILNQQEPDIPLHGGQSIFVPTLPDTVYLVGHLTRPGPIAYRPNLRLRDYLSLAGGTTSSAATKHGRIIHLDSPDAQPVITEVDILEVMEGEVPGPELHPGDVVYVPLYEPLLKDIFQVLSSLFYVSNFSNIFRR